MIILESYQSQVEKLSIFKEVITFSTLHNVEHCATFIWFMVIYVRRLIWEAANIKHIFRHDVTPDEVEEVCHANPLIVREKQGRLGVIGVTTDGRVLKVILQSKGRNLFYPVSAHEPKPRELALYKRLKGGEQK